MITKLSRRTDLPAHLLPLLGLGPRQNPSPKIAAPSPRPASKPAASPKAQAPAPAQASRFAHLGTMTPEARAAFANWQARSRERAAAEHAESVAAERAKNDRAEGAQLAARMVRAYDYATCRIDHNEFRRRK